MNYWQAAEASRRHRRDECPQEDVKKRLMDHVFDVGPEDEDATRRLSNGVVVNICRRPAGFTVRKFACRGCGWSVVEDRFPVPPCSKCGGRWFFTHGGCFDCFMRWYDSDRSSTWEG